MSERLQAGALSAVMSMSKSNFTREAERFRNVPTLLTPDEVAVLLRTTKKAIYAMIERAQLPGVVRIGRRVLIRDDELLQWLRQKSAPSPES